MATSSKRSRALTSALSDPNSAAGHHRATTGDCCTLMGKSESVSCGVTAPFSWVLVLTRFCCALQESVSPVLCQFWWIYGGVNGDLLQEGLCHTQVYCTQSPASAAGDSGLHLHRRHSEVHLAQSLRPLLVA